jgi:replicative DNA helicase
MDGPGVRAERALLGAVLLDPAGQASVLELVEPGDMGRPWHGQVLAAMQQVRAHDGAPGLAEVYAELQNDPDLPASLTRDSVLLAGLLDAAPRPTHAAAYAAIVVEGGIRRRLDLAGGRLTQAGESGDLDAALSQATRARRTVIACATRWLALPAQLRREVSACPVGSRVAADVADKAAVQEKGRNRHADGQAGQAPAQERAAAPASDQDQVAAAPEREAAAREAAGVAALRDLAAGPSQLGRVRGWLRPGQFAVPGHGAVYALMQDMDAARKPVDPVTVCWEAARRGLAVDPDTLAGGTGAFAVASARQVHQLGLLAQAAQAGRDIQLDASDLTCPPRHLLVAAHERLRELETALQPQAQSGRSEAAAGRASRRAIGEQARPEREAVL